MKLALKIRMRYPSIHGSWRSYLRGVVFIPATAQPILERVKGQGPEALRSELERLASLGASWAAALLGYRALLVDFDGTRNIDRAIALCQGPAARGDAFAQYILAWAYSLNHNSQDALVNFRKSARQLFPPAVLDYINACLRKGTAPTLRRLLMIAKGVGHCGTLSRRCLVYRSGKVGIFRRILGYALVPAAVLHYLIAAARNPFSPQVFVFHPKTKVDDFSIWDVDKHESHSL
jgi:hypothetical protein